MMIDTCAYIATTPLGLRRVGTQPNVVPQSRDNVGLWDGAPLGLMNVKTPDLGRCPGDAPGWYRPGLWPASLRATDATGQCTWKKS